MIKFSMTLAPSIAIPCRTIRAEQHADRMLHHLWSVLLHGEALPKKCLHLRFTSSCRGSLPARGVPCIQADLSWSSIGGVSVAHRLAVLVRALCSVLWALLHWHTFTPARTLVPVPSFTVAFSKTTCLQLAQSPVFAACLVEMLINMLCRSFFPTLFANILIELPLARILPI